MLNLYVIRIFKNYFKVVFTIFLLQSAIDETETAIQKGKAKVISLNNEQFFLSIQNKGVPCLRGHGAHLTGRA